MKGVALGGKTARNSSALTGRKLMLTWVMFMLTVTVFWLTLAIVGLASESPALTVEVALLT